MDDTFKIPSLNDSPPFEIDSLFTKKDTPKEPLKFTNETEELFPVDEEYTSTLLPTTIPPEMRVPTGLELMEMRNNFLEQFASKYGYLKAYVMIKAVAKVVDEKDKGLVSMLKGRAEKEFFEKYPNEKTVEVLGAKVSVSSGVKYYKYSENISNMENKIKELEAELKRLKSVEELTYVAVPLETRGSRTIKISI